MSINFFQISIKNYVTIHPSAQIDEGVKLGRNIKIGANNCWQKYNFWRQ